jgi:hypothetical protein
MSLGLADRGPCERSSHLGRVPQRVGGLQALVGLRARRRPTESGGASQILTKNARMSCSDAQQRESWSLG